MWVSVLCRDKSGNLVIILKDIVSWRGSSDNWVISTRISDKTKVKIVNGFCSEIKGIWEIPYNLSWEIYKGVVFMRGIVVVVCHKIERKRGWGKER